MAGGPAGNGGGLMRTWAGTAMLAGWLALCAPGASGAPLMPGAVAPNFTKDLLGGGSASLSTYSGKVVVLFLLGYS